MGTWEPYVHFQDAFTAAECARIIAYQDTMELAPAKVGNDTLDPAIRRSLTGWLSWGQETDWVFQKLAEICNDARDNWYPFTLTGFPEPLQLTRYSEHDRGHYSMHRDMGAGSMSTRKLSAVVLLSQVDEYSGGQLELMSNPESDQAVKQTGQGTVIVFPAWEMHRVSPVVCGTRWSLVAWVHGPRFS